MNILRSFVACLLLLATAKVFAVVETYEFDTEAERQRYEHFIDILRCPKCQNQNLAGSNSPIAADLRHELVLLLKQGKQDQEIIDFMVARYGDYVLYDPAFKKNTYVLWLAPLFLLAVGLLVFFFIIRKGPGSAISPLGATVDAVVSDSDELVVEALAPVQDSERRKAHVVFAVAALFVVVGSALVYARLGAGEQLKIAAVSDQFYSELRAANAEQRQPDLSSGHQLVDLLLPYLKKHNDDLNLVYMLGTVYVQLSEFEKALPWYKQYLLAVPTDERVLTEYVQLLYITANQTLSERLLFVVDRALTLNPHNQEVLSLMAMHYHRTGQYAEAADYWQRLLVTVPPDAEIYPSVKQALADARKRARK